MARVLLILALALTAVGLVHGAFEVRRHESLELAFSSGWLRIQPTMENGAPTPHMEIARTDLAQGETVTFEVCTADAMALDTWTNALDLVVWLPESQQVVVRTELGRETLEQARRSSEQSCLIIASGGDLQQSGTYAVEALWPGRELSEAVAQTEVMARVLAHRPLTTADRLPVGLVLVGALLALIAGGLTFRRRDSEPETEAATGKTLIRVCAGVVLFVGARTGLDLVPLGGATWAFCAGLALAAAEAVIAVALVKWWSALALAPPRAFFWIVAPVVGAAVWLLGQFLVDLFPTYGQAPIETFVAWPSGKLVASLVGVLVPLAEELFFRGFVYGSICRRYGTALAIVLTATLFVVAHLPQMWGAWGLVAALSLTSVALTLVRAASGSTLAAALAHLSHNGAIVIFSALSAHG